ncbi:MAG TPA: polyprenyl diphosphate synthase [Longimicrobiales bacterium]|nr:polyprenyl diphosphate synthase [Longimicrobiales bacterium]
MQRTPRPPGLHVGIIMDGNGRWATARGRRREVGHRAGAQAVRRVVRGAPDLGVGTLTLYAFSSDNWQRPEREVRALMGLFRRYLRSEAGPLAEAGVRLRVVGRRDRLPGDVLDAVRLAEQATTAGSSLLLRLAVDYSSRYVLREAARRFAASGPDTVPEFPELIADAMNCPDGAPDVDLLIRTGGEQRLSDFLLWECAYAELHFSARMWPDFDAPDLASAIRDFHGRDRRFGRVAAAG